MNSGLLNKITHGDCLELLPELEDCSVDLFLSDIPYGISLDNWDVLHSNTNSALLGMSPAQEGKSGFKRRGKPINGWSQSDRNIGLEYEDWCKSWAQLVFPKMKNGAFLFVFGARRTIHRVVNAFEDSGFLLKDLLSWRKKSAHHRAQRVSLVFERRGLTAEAEKWEGWRLGNLAPIWEPIAWFMKPYTIGRTITDNVLENEVGAINIDACKVSGTSPTNLLEFGFQKNEVRLHEAQKPIELIKYLILLATREGHLVLDPFMGSGTTAVAAKSLSRRFVGFEISSEFHTIAKERLSSLRTFDKGKRKHQNMKETPKKEAPTVTLPNATRYTLDAIIAIMQLHLAKELRPVATGQLKKITRGKRKGLYVAKFDIKLREAIADGITVLQVTETLAPVRSIIGHSLVILLKENFSIDQRFSIKEDSAHSIRVKLELTIEPIKGKGTTNAKAA